jgi:hypothetical protein
MSGLDEGWASTVSTWARAQPDINALVQIGSRVQKDAVVDRWSDYDYHLVTSRPEKYRDASFCRELGECWASGAQIAFGNAVKVTGVYADALEADFVILKNWEVRIALAALCLPSVARFWPRPLAQGIAGFRTVVAPGWRVIKGGKAWERRYARVAPFRAPLTEADFDSLCGEFWTQLIWAAKKAQRGECRAAQRCLHLHLIENSLRMLQEQAVHEGRKAYPLGRRAEAWLDGQQLTDTNFSTSPNREALLAALIRIMLVFEKSSGAVAKESGWNVMEYPKVRKWMESLGAG